ncbi:MAG TPA: SDR family oxidoreductase [Pyrinomonadaceae bacterium]|jgi:3-oxoacyl-[acyl-carrier protein] reductase
MQLEEVRAIVSGAASGLGRHFTLALASAGALVAAGDIDQAALDALAVETANLKGRVITLKLDVAQETSVVEFVNRATQEFGGVNLLVNNAGILRDGLLAKDEGGWVRKLPQASWKQVMDVNLTGAYMMTREVVADVLKRGIKESVIVNISSISRAGNPGQSNYAASKAGLDACTRTWALELAPHSIRVGGIAPGLIETPILRHISEEALKSLTDKIPLQRVGTPQEIWLALKFIIECDYFTGRVIEVDGGSTF